MAKANASLSPKLALEIAQRRHHAIVVLAIQRAKKAVKAQLQAQGHKVAHYSAKEIAVMADQYLSQHRHELIVEAIGIVERWTAEGVFGKRAQRAAESVRNVTGLRTLAQPQPHQCEENWQ
jgi:hypothetical protein